MNNKKILIIGITIIVICLMIVLFLIFSSDIFGAIERNRVIKELKNTEDIEYVLVNDNRSENYFGGEYIESDPNECERLVSIIAEALEGSSFGGVKANSIGGFGLMVRISYGEDIITLWFYEDRIELENGSDIVICKIKDSTVFDFLLTLTE